MRSRILHSLNSQVLLVGIGLAVTACHGSHEKASEGIRLFIKDTSPAYAGVANCLADTLFHYAIPLSAEGVQFVYVLNASCSVCIADALACYDAYCQEESPSSFYFLSRTEDTEIFRYYFHERYGKDPHCFWAKECETLPDGIYSIKDRHVLTYSPWKRQ